MPVVGTLGRNIPDPVEDLGSSVSLDILADSHHDQTELHQEEHAGETLWSSPDIKNLRKWYLEDTSNEAGHDRCGCCQRVGRERTGNKWSERASGGRLRSIDKVDAPNSTGALALSHDDKNVANTYKI